MSESDFSNKLFFYLKTLNDIADIINKEVLSVSEEKIVFFANSHGCLCSPDSPKYNTCPIKTRHFENSKGIKEYFSLHLKPITYNIKHAYYELTRRIYFKWKEDKFLIGWIGEHPQTCTNDPDSICVKINCPKIPKEKPLSPANPRHYTE